MLRASAVRLGYFIRLSVREKDRSQYGAIQKISSVNIALIIINIILFLIPDFFGFLISGDVLLEKER